MPRFALLGNGPLSNRGCEAIVLSTVGLLNTEFGDSDYLLASFADDSNERPLKGIEPLSLPYRLDRWSKLWWQYRLNQLRRRPENIASFLKHLEGHLDNVQAALSIGGDGYATEYGHTIVDRLMVMDEYVRSKGKPVIIWGASIGPFENEPEFEEKIARHFQTIDLIVVREPISLDYLARLGVMDNVILAPDPAFALEAKPCKLAPEIERILATGCIGLNLSPLLARYAAFGSIEKWSTLALQIVRRLLSEMKRPILLIPHATFANYSPLMDDDYFLRGIYLALTDTEKTSVSIIPRGLTSQNLKWIISQTSLFIGARTHATIAALSSFVPCLSIAYSRKAWGINEMVFGHRKWVFSSESLDSVELVNQVKKVWHSREQLRSHLREIIPLQIIDLVQAVKKVKLLISKYRALVEHN